MQRSSSHMENMRIRKQLKRAGQVMTNLPVSCHDFFGITCSMSWREVEPKKWKMNRLTSLVKSACQTDFPDELKKVIDDVETVIRAWLEGSIPKLPLDVLDYDGVELSPRYRAILEVLYNEVPRGRVITYKELGEKAGLGPWAARPVGNAMRRNPWPLFYPCHRVLASDLSFGKYSMGGQPVKAQLLQMEGVKFANGFCKQE
jgi:O-6-methylguanine DNA methyltransferase